MFYPPSPTGNRGELEELGWAKGEEEAGMLLRPGAFPLFLMSPALGEDIWDINWGE